MNDQQILILTLGLAATSLVICCVMMILFIQLKSKYKKFTRLTKEVDIEGVLIENQSMILQNQKTIENHGQHLLELDNQLRITYSKMEVTKYNAFDGLGGQMSAIIVLLNDHGNGVLLHSIHTGDGNHLYTKILENGKALQNLSKEEEETLKKALKRNI